MRWLLNYGAFFSNEIAQSSWNMNEFSSNTDLNTFQAICIMIYLAHWMWMLFFFLVGWTFQWFWLHFMLCLFRDHTCQRIIGDKITDKITWQNIYQENEGKKNYKQKAAIK